MSSAKKTSRKVSADSVYNRQQDLFAKSYGPLTNEGTEWTNDQIDELLDAFLIEECRYLSARNCLRRVTGRSVKGVTEMIRKLATRYPRGPVLNYIPTGHIHGRTGDPFTIRDKVIIELATSKAGRKYGADNVAYVAKLLGRTVEEVAEFYFECQVKTAVRPYIGKPLTVKAEFVYQAVRGSYKKLMSEIGL